MKRPPYPMKLILVDGNALFYRAFYAIPNFHTSKGELTNAVYGFIGMLLNLLLKEQPDYIAIAWDSKAKTFRHEAYAQYKATRPPPPEGMYEQLPRLKSLLEAFHIPMFAQDGYEADDILATLTKQANQLTKQANQSKDLHIYIATGDRDALQLIDKNTSVIIPEYGFQKYAIYDPTKTKEKYGVSPEQIVDYKSLVGDTSDNIPGVKGIGEQTAADLLQKYYALEKIYEHLEELSPGVQKKLREGKESAFFSKKLVTLDKNVPMTLLLEECKTHGFDIRKIEEIFEELEFKSLFKRLRDLEGAYNEKRQQQYNYKLPLIF